MEGSDPLEQRVIRLGPRPETWVVPETGVVLEMGVLSTTRTYSSVSLSTTVCGQPHWCNTTSFTDGDGWTQHKEHPVDYSCP